MKQIKKVVVIVTTMLLFSCQMNPAYATMDSLSDANILVQNNTLD